MAINWIHYCKHLPGVSGREEKKARLALAGNSHIWGIITAKISLQSRLKAGAGLAKSQTHTHSCICVCVRCLLRLPKVLGLRASSSCDPFIISRGEKERKKKKETPRPGVPTVPSRLFFTSEGGAAWGRASELRRESALGMPEPRAARRRRRWRRRGEDDAAAS